MMLMVKTLLGLFLVSAGVWLFIFSLTITDKCWGFVPFMFGFFGGGGGLVWSIVNTMEWIELGKERNEHKTLNHQHQMRLLKMRHADIEKAAEEDPY